MYRIIQLKDGGCQCKVNYENGIEEWITKNLQQAVQTVIKTAEELNHERITIRDIRILQENR